MSYENQLAQLKQRGLNVTDDNKALAYLKRIGYYRLSGYWFPFRERSGECCLLESSRKQGRVDRLALDTFKPGACFQDAVHLYVFDKRLRLLVLDALERVEIALRVDITHFLGEIDPVAYRNIDLFDHRFSKKRGEDGKTRLERWQNKHQNLVRRSSEEFIKHYQKRYDPLPLPIWIASEVWDFGAMSTLFGGMKGCDQDTISLKYGIANGRHFASWLRSLNYLRNVCAHHSRLWNRNIIDQPKLSASGESEIIDRFRGNPQLQARPFLLLCMLQHLLVTVNPSSSWWQRLTDHLNNFPELNHLGLNLKGMGVIEGWNEWQWL
ncbi:Abi family protein [Endozoicomonadaceae bacterium StTr2]